jgi:hypothetical protein
MCPLGGARIVLARHHALLAAPQAVDPSIRHMLSLLLGCVKRARRSCPHPHLSPSPPPLALTLTSHPLTLTSPSPFALTSRPPHPHPSICTGTCAALGAATGRSWKAVLAAYSYRGGGGALLATLTGPTVVSFAFQRMRFEGSSAHHRHEKSALCAWTRANDEPCFELCVLRAQSTATVPCSHAARYKWSVRR